jgi:signal transduction histidine kinase
VVLWIEHLERINMALNPQSDGICRVLIAEDDPDAVKQVQALLSAGSYKIVAQLNSGLTVVEEVIRTTPDVVLMDISLPGKSGLEASIEIQQVRPTPIVILTMHDDEAMVRRAAEAGAGAFLVKPPKNGDLERAISIARARFQDLLQLRALSARLQEEIRQKEKLTQQLRDSQEAVLRASRLEATATLAGGIAHEFNNLMLSVLGNAELLQSCIENQPESREMLEDIIQAAHRASEISRQILAYSRQGKYQCRRLNLNQCIQKAFSLQQIKIPSNIDLDLNLASGLFQIDADENQVLQIIVNLLTNAVESIEESGHTGIATSNVYLPRDYAFRSLPPGNYVQLMVFDDGCGIEQDLLSRVFEPFFSTKFPGRGLGLSAVFGIVKNHHGHIDIESTPGKGTKVTVLLPAVIDQAGKE